MSISQIEKQEYIRYLDTIGYDVELDIDEDEDDITHEEQEDDEWAAYRCCGGHGCNYCR